MSKVECTRLFFDKQDRGDEVNFTSNTKPHLCMRNQALSVSVNSFLFYLLKVTTPVMKAV